MWKRLSNVLWKIMAETMILEKVAAAGRSHRAKENSGTPSMSSSKHAHRRRRPIGHSAIRGGVKRVRRTSFSRPINSCLQSVEYAGSFNVRYDRQSGFACDVLCVGDESGAWGWLNRRPFGKSTRCEKWMGIDGEIARSTARTKRRRRIRAVNAGSVGRDCGGLHVGSGFYERD